MNYNEHDEKYILSMEGLPLEDLLPGLLVVSIVYADDVRHVIRGQVCILPAPTCNI